MIRILMILLAIVSSGCATIIDGKNQSVSFDSEPKGATVIVNGRTLGVTPTTVQIEKVKGQSLKIEKEGFKVYETQLSTHLNSWFWGNIVIGGLLGSTTDGVTGAMYEYEPNQYYVTLVSASGGAVEKPITQKVKDYVVINYQSILSDLLKGGTGEYVKGLLSLLNITQEKEKSEAVHKIDSLANGYKDAVSFADAIIRNFKINE
jgi:hypothetical protein